MAATRWGICSAGVICGDFCAALKSLPSTDHEIVAVAARNLERANRFAKTYSIPNAYEGYERLAADPNIDIVYVGTIHPYHYENVMMMLKAEKHVLCEKPMALNLKHAREMIELAREKNLFFMEGYWSRFFPVYKQIKKELNEGTIGEINLVKAEFCIPLMDKDRMHNLEMGGGALLDIGCYPIQFALMVFGEAPHKIVASGNKYKTGADDSSMMVLHFSENRLAFLATSATTQGENKAVVYGTKGKLEVPSTFWSPVDLITPSGTKHFKLPESALPVHFVNSEGFQYEAKCVRECLLQGKIECDVVSHQDSLDIMTVIETVKQQLGIVYDVDK